MKISNRATKIQASPLRKLMPFANAAKKEGKKIYHLNIGQPDIATPKAMLDVYRNFDKEVLCYGPSQGLEVYRKNLLNYYAKHGIELNIDNILVTTAGSEALIFALLSSCNPGDEVIIPEPFYTNYNGFATIAGVKIVPLTTFAENGFELPSDDKITALITEKTRAILLCNPGNPTGTVYPQTDIERLAQIALKNNLFIISDEVYREFTYDGLTHTSILDIAGLEKNAIMVDSISKRFSACGARIGALVSRNEKITTSLLKFAQARLCPPTLDQLAANACLDLEEDYFVNILKEYDQRRTLVFNELQKIENIVCSKPQGAFYIIAKLPIEDAEDFVKWMLTEFSYKNETVMFAPAQGFYATPEKGKNEVRLAYVLNTEDLKKAMLIFRKGLERYISIT